MKTSCFARALAIELAFLLHASCLHAAAPEEHSSNGAGETPPFGDGDVNPGNRVWGVTVTNPFNLKPTVNSLAQLSRRVTARVVFDLGQSASTYVQLVPRIHGVADVMGEILDSQFVSLVTPAQYVARTQEYLDALGDNVDVWEVGNEMNAEWLGTTSDVVAKLRGAYDLVKQRGKRAALTLYYNHECWKSADHEMFTWAEANIPPDIKAGLDWVLVSYYEDDCEGYQPNLQAEFNRLGTMFPNAQLGIGECGTAYADRKEAYLTRYYSMRVNHPRYIGGYFWWYFSEDMVPQTAPLWSTLDSLLRSF